MKVPFVVSFNRKSFESIFIETNLYVKEALICESFDEQESVALKRFVDFFSSKMLEDTIDEGFTSFKDYLLEYTFCDSHDDILNVDWFDVEHSEWKTIDWRSATVQDALMKNYRALYDEKARHYTGQ